MLKPSCSVRTERHDESKSGFSQFREKRLKRDEENKTFFSQHPSWEKTAMDQFLGWDIKIMI